MRRGLVAHVKSTSSRLFATPRHRLPLIRCTTFRTTRRLEMQDRAAKQRFGPILLGELRLFSQETARSRRRSQVLLRLALLMDARFFGAVSCDLLRAESEANCESQFESASKANTYGTAGCQSWMIQGPKPSASR